MTRPLAGGTAKLLVALLFTLSFILPPSITPDAAAESRGERIHPKLAQIAGQTPDARVRVIVQGDNTDDTLGKELDRRGGSGKKALPLIKGYAAEISAREARALADLPGVKQVSIDAEMFPTADFDVDALATDYPRSVNADDVWSGKTPYTGKGVTVAVIDSGIQDSQDLRDSSGHRRIVEAVNVGPASASGTNDSYGHGTHVAGIIASNGSGSDGKYVGIAPDAKLINVKVANEKGGAYLSDVVEGVAWVIRNRQAYNIRIVNITLLSSVPESYLTSPLNAAVEAAWLSGIVVVVSAGNLGPNSTNYAPANDPFVITVGAVDTNLTPDIADDVMPAWSSFGVSLDGVSKPDVVAPGRRIISNGVGQLRQQYPDRIVDQRYLKLSGTSMAAPVVSGIAALALQAHPSWTPDQVKGALLATARPLRDGTGAGRGIVDALAVTLQSNPTFANSGLPLHLGLSSLVGRANYDSATWNSATWNSATWNSATWNSATWNSATWNSATWNSATWNSATWNSATWNSAVPD
jgi:serine protease AprX